MLVTRLRAGVPALALVVTLALSGMVAWVVFSTAATRDALHIERLVDDTSRRIQTRIDTYIVLLRAGAALFTASEEVQPLEFRAFVERLQVPRRYPGVQGIGFSRAIRPGERGAVELAQQSYWSGFRIWPDTPRDEYHSIVYLEPLDQRNAAALGYDMFTDPTRRAAMGRARDTGEPAASARVTLVQEIDEAKQPGFLIYVPVYRPGLPTRTIAERRQALLGFVYAPFRAGDLLQGTLGDRSGEALGFRIYDGPREDAASLLYEAGHADARPGRARGRLRESRTIMVAGRPWTIAFFPLPAFDQDTPLAAAALALAVGILLSLALFAIVRAQQEGLRAAESHAAELRRSQEELSAREALLRDLVAREREARDRAEAADRAKDEFLATLSHELRTPLNAVMGWASMLQTGQIREERRAEALAVIARNARAQYRLIEDLLDVSRMITGKMRIDLSPVPIAIVLRDTIETVRPSAEARGVRLIMRVPDDVGAVLGDAARLRQIVWNLLSNAIKFTDPGGTVTVEAAADGGQVQVTVADTGIGIAPEFLPFVFDRFRQADSSMTRSYGGVGLGLAIARHLVELQGGWIEAHSEGLGRGARFTVHLAGAPVDAARPTATERGPAGIEP